MSQNTESHVLVELPSNYIPEPSRRCKILIAGSKKVGKSAFIERIESGKFNDKKAEESLHRVIVKKIFEQKLTVELLEKDLEEFTNGETLGAKQQHMKDVDALIIFYAINDLQSFEMMKHNLPNLQRKIPPSAAITIVGGKADASEIKVPWRDVDTFAETQGFSCFETSSKTGVNVDIIMQDILETVFERRFATEDDEEIFSDQPVYATTVLTSNNEEPAIVNGFCWIPLISYFRRKETN
ncbi:Protein CBG08054 [Caenorhabditis briggsae]|uniref:Uncharacterized protein n=2 Tax=Caenorhabditis briggsae TaxID=6238 RepID=A0AAE8ZNU2_CAEBR|nr:Protein CBG08054 [Caenorhabditis briggsae]ULT79566.1 hypothetical protein L3Y34_010277 [Caenorhabditis briggsae]CAP27954.1 Protein CBG08054 [Caenorhabditis briggsae]